MPTVNLTESRLGRPVKAKREQLHDSRVPGLRARGGPRGWVFYFQSGAEVVSSDGTAKRLVQTLGRWSPVPGRGLSIKEARLAALALAGQGGGAYRPDGALAVKASNTVRALAKAFLATRYPDNAERREKVRTILENHALATIGGKSVREVTRRDCSALVKAAQRKGRSPAVELIRVLKQLFDHAINEDWLGKDATPADNPAALLDAKNFGITDVEPRQRWLNAEELARLFLHKEIDLPGLLEGKPGPEFGLSTSVRAAIILGPHMAVRPKALVGLRWDEVDLEAATATIRGGRGAKLKHGRKAKDFVVPLSTTAVAVLRALEKGRGERQWVFPSASETGHLSGDVYADAMLRVSARLELPGGPVRPHDARRTFGNTAINLKVERLVVERCLQHSLGKIGDTYLGDTVEKLRRAAHELVDANWTAFREGKPAKIVQLR